MDTRDTPEQAELRRTAHRLARELGPRTVADLDDEKRSERLAEAVRDAGWLELRLDGGDGAPFASGIEAAIIADALGEAVADVPFAGPVLAADLARRAGVRPFEGAVVAFSPDLIDAAVVPGAATDMRFFAVDCAAAGPASAYVLAPEGDGYRLATVEVDGASDGTDLTRAVRPIPAGTSRLPVADPSRLLTRADLDAWAALGLALMSADLVGLMRGVLGASVAYARERRQYGVPIGTFQAVQHLLAEARAAGRVAKAYCARAARTVCETAVQVHGGMGTTWDCIVHVHLRRALLSSQWFGDDGEQLRQLERTRLGVSHGLS
jgi:alkylation response protein AidB-like acyl-CoA dehydrogenase